MGKEIGIQYIPSNEDAGDEFMDTWCRNCARDRAMRDGDDVEDCDDEELCDIIEASYRGKAVEWRELTDGTKICTAYVEAGKPIPPRCEKTVDMFGDGG